MTHHDEQLRKELLARMQQRIARVKEVVHAYEAGGLSEGKALSEIEEIASGEADRIVRPGAATHTPEIQS